MDRTHHSKSVALLCVLLLCGALGAARAQPETAPELAPEPPRPFGQGTSMGGLVLGFGSSSGNTSFTFGGSYGYFVLDGVAPGLSALVTTSSGSPNTLELTPFVRVVPWRAYPVSPMLIVEGGRLFVEDYPDFWIFGGGGGLVYFASSHLALTIEVVYERLFAEAPAVDTSRTVVSGGAGIFF